MIELFDIKPCADLHETIQAEGKFNLKNFSIPLVKPLIDQINFTTLSIGNPEVLVCKRQDCWLMIHSDGTFIISKILSRKTLETIIQEITRKMHVKEKP